MPAGNPGLYYKNSPQERTDLLRKKLRLAQMGGSPEPMSQPIWNGVGGGMTKLEPSQDTRQISSELKSVAREKLNETIPGLEKLDKSHWQEQLQDTINSKLVSTGNKHGIEALSSRGGLQGQQGMFNAMNTPAIGGNVIGTNAGGNFAPEAFSQIANQTAAPAIASQTIAPNAVGGAAASAAGAAGAGAGAGGAAGAAGGAGMFGGLGSLLSGVLAFLG